MRDAIVGIAERAGAAILEIYRSDFAVSHKDDASPLTAADMAAHHVIVDALAALTPDLPVLSEESAAIDVATRRAWQRYWLVDPLDGTREFVKRNGEFTVNIALIDGGRPRLGVVYAPDRGELFVGEEGDGAYDLSDGSEPRRLAVSASTAEPPRIAGSRSHRDPRMGAFLERVGDHELLAVGSSLKFCLIAAGRADVYVRLGPTSEWDTAAGQCVLECAGGRVTDLDGQTLSYNRRASLLNPDFLASADNGARWRALLAELPT
jgi:3'(2'), 5'-bisphosphate nucleotidase